jgi:hypothetical protein
MLSEFLVSNGIRTEHAEADADVMIANTGIALAENYLTIIIGKDTDGSFTVCVIFSAWPQGVTIKYNNWMCISFYQIIKVHLTNLSEGCTFIPNLGKTHHSRVKKKISSAIMKINKHSSTCLVNFLSVMV